MIKAGTLPDNNRQTPSFIVVKVALRKLFFARYFSNYGFDV